MWADGTSYNSSDFTKMTTGDEQIVLEADSRRCDYIHILGS